MVNTAQVRSGHLGSASGSHSGSDMAPAPPCGACHVRYEHRQGLDTVSTRLLSAFVNCVCVSVSETRGMVAPRSTLGRVRAQSEPVTIFAKTGPLQPKGDGFERRRFG